MAATSAALCLGAAVLVWFAPRVAAASRLDQVDRAGRSGREGFRDLDTRLVRPGSEWLGSLRGTVARAPTIVAVGIGVLVAAAVGGGLGILLGCAAGVFTRRVLHGTAVSAAGQRSRRLAVDLPLATELLAACLAAGALPPQAAEAVAGAVNEPLAGELRRVVATLRLGGDPVRTWAGLTEGPLQSLGAAFVRSADTGAPLVNLLTELATELRSRERIAAEAEARRVAIRAAAPLGLCFLPAFVLIGLVPIVAGLVQSLSI